MPGLIPWWSLLPAAPDLSGTSALQNQALRLKLQAAQQQQQGYNAMAQLFRDPGNLQNGMLKPEAIAQLGGVYPPAALDLMEAQAKIGQQRQLTAMRGVEFGQKMAQSATDALAPLVSEYDKDVGAGALGPDAALQKYRKSVLDKIDELASSGAYTPQFIDGLRRNPPNPEQLRALALGAKAIQSSAQQREEQRKDTELDIKRLDAVRKANQPTLIGDVKAADGTITKGVPLSYGGKTGFRNAQGEDVEIVNGTVHKIGTKTEEDAATAGAPTGPADLHGDEYLKALPASRAALVRGYAEGRVPFPGSFSLRSPYWQKMVADITQFDPTFDAVNYNARSTTRKDFTAGKSAQNITSIDTAIGHLGTLAKAADGLENRWSPTWNTVANFLESETGDPRVVRFNTAKQAVADELTRAFRGTGGNVSDIKDWEKNLNSSNSPEQLHAAVAQAVELLASRINAIGEQYRRGMGTTADVTELLTPAAKRTLAALPNGEQILNDVGMRRAGTRGEPAAAPSAASTPPVANAPSAGAPPSQSPGAAPEVTEEQYNQLPSGSAYRVPGNPRVMYKP